jgi:3-methyladenine DNA glycosylase AlkD
VAADQLLIEEIRRTLAAAGDPSRAPGMQAYTKSALPCRGVAMGPLRRLVRECIDVRPPSDRECWADTVVTLYAEADYREERYAALVLAGHRRAKAWRTPDCLPMYRRLVELGAWWDLVDWVAVQLVGPLLRDGRADAAGAPDVVRAWAEDDDLWIRRTAVICQVGAKADVDLELLSDCLLPNLDRKEFWLRKACGWALREASRRDPAWVQAFVSAHDDQFSGLTRREALRLLPVRSEGPR